MSGEGIGLAVFSAILGSALTIMVLANIGLTSEVTSKMNECQKDLPRNQTCVLIAIPKQETIQEK